MTRRVLPIEITVVALSVLFAPLVAQSPAPATQPLEFDVVSVKPNNSGIPRVGLQFPGGRLNGINITVQALFGLAFRVQPFQIVGAPDWVGSERFDVMATSTVTPTLDQRASMVQALLADRFKLSVHRETSELPVYGLVLAKNDGTLGPRLRRSELDCVALAAAARGGAPLLGGPGGGDPRGAPRGGPGAPGQPAPAGQPQVQVQQAQLGGCGSTGGPGQRTSRGVTMAELATSLSGLVNRVVINRTGLGGAFDFELQWTPDQFQGAGPLGGIPGAPPPAPSTDSTFPSLFTALQEQLGLRLDSQRGPVEVIVIDHVERPTPD